MEKTFQILRSRIVPIIISLTVILLFNTVFLFGYVPTESMEPTLKAGDFVVGLRVYKELEKGDVIIFKYGDFYLVKRIAAVSGETIIYRGESVTVPENCFYVLGDNSESSFDSRYWNEPFISKDQVIARVL